MAPHSSPSRVVSSALNRTLRISREDPTWLQFSCFPFGEKSRFRCGVRAARCAPDVDSPFHDLGEVRGQPMIAIFAAFVEPYRDTRTAAQSGKIRTDRTTERVGSISSLSQRFWSN